MEKSKIYNVIILIFVVTLVYSFTVFCGSDDEKKGSGSSQQSQSTQGSSQPAAKKQEAIKISAAKLHQDYNANEVSADDKYKNKLLEVTGVIEDIRKDFMDNIVIDLKAKGSFLGVNCTMKDSEKSKAAKLKKGNKISIIGVCSGFTMKSVGMRDGVIK